MIDKYQFNKTFNLDIKKSVAFTGHRELEQNFDIKKVEEYIKLLIEKGYENFFIGMAVGFDTVCFKIVEKLKRTNEKIKIIACIPCLEQDKKFSSIQKGEYKKMLLKADQKVLISQNYTPYCMNERNRFMVDNASLIVCYMVHNKGGTVNTVKYANLLDKTVVNVAEFF